jgi:hypothetical protein
LILLVSLILSGCIPGIRLGEIQDQEDASLKRFDPLNTQDSWLFKASIEAGKRKFSGLFLIKSFPGEHDRENQSVTRIVFLNELGLNLLDMQYQEGEFEVVSVQDFLDRPTIIRVLQNEFRALLLDLSLMENPHLEDAGGDGEVLHFRLHRDRFAYFFADGSGCYRIERKRGLLRGSDAVLTHGDILTIELRPKRGRVEIQLREVQR